MYCPKFLNINIRRDSCVCILKRRCHVIYLQGRGLKLLRNCFHGDWPPHPPPPPPAGVSRDQCSSSIATLRLKAKQHSSTLGSPIGNSLGKSWILSRLDNFSRCNFHGTKPIIFHTNKPNRQLISIFFFSENQINWGVFSLNAGDTLDLICINSVFFIQATRWLIRSGIQSEILSGILLDIRRWTRGKTLWLHAPNTPPPPTGLFKLKEKKTKENKTRHQFPIALPSKLRYTSNCSFFFFSSITSSVNFCFCLIQFLLVLTVYQSDPFLALFSWSTPLPRPFLLTQPLPFPFVCRGMVTLFNV